MRRRVLVVATAGIIIACLASATAVRASPNQTPPLPQASPPPKDALDTQLSRDEQMKLGWQRLTQAERDATAAFLKQRQQTYSAILQRVTTAQQADQEDASATGWEPADAHLSSNGWEKMKCQIVSVEGKDVFVVKHRWRTYGTLDVPLLLTQMKMKTARPDGEFWCKGRMRDGISEILVGGSEFAFRFADWKELD